MRKRRSLIAVLLLLCGCSAKQLGIPRTPVESPSPDGRYVALVRNHFSIDPPKQSLWLRGDTGRIRLARLGEDTHWCNAIAWSDDSKQVAFLIQDASAMVFDSATHRLVETIQLVEPDHYPTSRAVRKLEFTATGGGITVTVCNRRLGTGCETATVPLSS